MQMITPAKTKVHDMLGQFYPLPDPYDTLEQFMRYHHADIPGLSSYERWRETQRVELRLVLDELPHPWLLERLAMLRGEV